MVKLKSIVLGVIGLSLLLTLPGMLINQSEPNDYIQPEVCSGCHAEIYEQWNGSMHSNSHKDPVYEKLFLMASRETNNTSDPFCSKCHAPIDFLAGNIPSEDNYEVSEFSEKGISCDFCHTINATSGNGSFISSPGLKKRGPQRDSNYSTFHESTYSELQTKSEFCGICHNANHPFNGLILENTYTEWKEGEYNETTTCQDCHMTPGVTGFKANPGRSAPGAPMRDNIYTHYFVGGNSMLPGLLSSPEHERLAKERLQAAARVEIIRLERTNDNKSVNLTIKVTNIGAGHKIPTGLTEARLIWIEVDAKDLSGKTIFGSGEIDKGGYIDPGAVKYHTILGDSNNKPTEKVWLAEKILLDNRIPPKGYSIENYSFDIPNDLEGPLSVDVRLNYASASQELSDLLFGKGEIKPPVVEMASAKAKIDVTPFVPVKKTPGFTFFSFMTAILILYARIRRITK